MTTTTKTATKPARKPYTPKVSKAEQVMQIIAWFNNPALKPSAPRLHPIKDNTSDAKIAENLMRIDAYRLTMEADQNDYRARSAQHIATLRAFGAGVNVCAKKHLGQGEARCITALDIADVYSGDKSGTISKIVKKFKG